MLLVKDTNGKIHCAKCNKKLIKSEVVKDRLIPVGICSIPRNEANYVGVCSDCHKERLKKKLRKKHILLRQHLRTILTHIIDLVKLGVDTQTQYKNTRQVQLSLCLKT